MTESLKEQSAFEKLTTACRRQQSATLRENIDQGPARWMLGVPVSAEEGLIGISTSPTQVVYLRTEDVLEARESADKFLVRVREGATTLVREEQVVKMNRPTPCNCPATSASKALIGTPSHGQSNPPVTIDCSPICEYELVCRPYSDPSTLATILLCSYELRCFNPCEGGPII